MSSPKIAPLAKKLAEENNVPWQRLKGSGDNGLVIERDVLEYLARVMHGEEDVNPTPEPTPDGMEAWPEEDVAEYMRNVDDTAENAAGAAADNAASDFDAFSDDSFGEADPFASGDDFGSDDAFGTDDAFGEDDLFAADTDDPFGGGDDFGSDDFGGDDFGGDDFGGDDAFSDVSDPFADATSDETNAFAADVGSSDAFDIDGDISDSGDEDLFGVDEDLFALDDDVGDVQADVGQTVQNVDEGIKSSDDPFGYDIDAPSSDSLDRDVFGTDPFGDGELDPAVFEMDTDMADLDADFDDSASNDSGLNDSGFEDSSQSDLSAEYDFGADDFSDSSSDDEDLFSESLDDSFDMDTAPTQTMFDDAAQNAVSADTVFLDAPSDFDAAEIDNFSEPSMPVDDDDDDDDEDSFLEFDDFGAGDSGAKDVFSTSEIEEDDFAELTGASATDELQADVFAEADDMVDFAADDPFADEVDLIADSGDLDMPEVEDIALEDDVLEGAAVDGLMETDLDAPTDIDGLSNDEFGSIDTVTDDVDLESLSEDDFADIDLDGDLGIDSSVDVTDDVDLSLASDVDVAEDVSAGMEAGSAAFAADVGVSASANATGAKDDEDDSVHLDLQEDVQVEKEEQKQHVQVAPVEGLPLMQHGVVVRRHVDMKHVVASEHALEKDLGDFVTRDHAAFLVRAVARALQHTHLVEGVQTLALAKLNADSLALASLANAQELASQSFTTVVKDIANLAQGEASSPTLIVTDLSQYDIDEAVLNLGAPVLMLGQLVPQKTEEGDNKLQATLTLSGDVSLDKAATLLATVAALLETPIRLTV